MVTAATKLKEVYSLKEKLYFVASLFCCGGKPFQNENTSSDEEKSI